MNVAFFGGSFDPPHVAHVLAVAYALSVGRFDRVLVVPAFEHALKKPRAAFEDRLQMCERALGFMSNVEICGIEERLGQPSFTLRTLQALALEHPDWRLRLMIGSDVLFETQKWHAFEQVAELAPPFVLGRAGQGHPQAPECVLPDISSSRVRELLTRRNEPAVREQLAGYVPGAVLAFIDQNGLYR
jgi:nicotinate-nucleotide adenylyltransferase